ncbi:MAG: phenylacetic acid degradation bifunctional protein PaaZ, partial [Saprospiraceae bacterium]
MQNIQNFIAGQWISGDGPGQPLMHAITGEQFATVSSKGLDFQGMFDFARDKGNKSLRKMTFQERALMLKALALYLMDRKEKYYEVSYKTGATRVDSWVDIEGGIGNLFANASLRRKLPNQPFCIDGEYAPLSKEGSFIGQHILVPKLGVALHINAFNFPVWGMLEKVAVNLLAGMPAIVKPAAITSYLTEVVFRDIIESGLLPAGALQLVTGSAHNLIDFVNEQDVVTFTGSADTGRLLKRHENIIEHAVPFNMEADSLNCCILGSDAVFGTPEFDLFIKEVKREVTTKAGQKCTAIRRIIVPENMVEDVSYHLTEALSQVMIGDTKHKNVRMGALVGKGQVEEVKGKVVQLLKDSELVYGLDELILVGDNTQNGSFMGPVLLRATNTEADSRVHDIEAFGPVSTIIGYKDIDHAIELANRGKGSLVSSIVTYDDAIATQYTLGAAPYHGRIMVLNRDCAKESTGHGSPMPLLTHGGPGRAGGGEEMGGLRGIKHYMQRCAVQGSPTTLTEITQV